MGYGVLPLYSSHLYNLGNMNEASSSSTFPRELADLIEDDKVTFYSNDFGLEHAELYNYYQQPDHRAIDVPLQSFPLMIDYQPASLNNYNPILQKPLSPRMNFSDWRCHQSFREMENPKKRMKDVLDQKAVNKKLAHLEQMQGNGCVRERVPMRRSQKLADKITALQKLVSPYGKTDTASVLEETHLYINLLQEQIQKLLFNKQTSVINVGPQNNEEAETSLQNRGLCLVPISPNHSCMGHLYRL